jgi:DNA-binding transcriptional LysR family regulator
MADCLKYPLVLPTLGLSIRATLNRVIGHHANELRAFVETNSLNFMNRLVHSGRFVGFLTRLGIEEFLKAGSLAFIELSELGPGTEQFVVVTDAILTHLLQLRRAFGCK